MSSRFVCMVIETPIEGSSKALGKLKELEHNLLFAN